MSAAVEFITIPEMFDKLTARFAGETKPVLMYKSDGSYKGIRYMELRRQVELFASGLGSLGLKRGDRISIISENRPEWVVADQAIALLGGISVPLYPTMTAKQIEYIFNDATVRFAIVSNQFQLNKVAKISVNVPTLEKTIIMGEKPAVQAGPGIVAFSRVMSLGGEFERENPDYLRASMKTV